MRSVATSRAVRDHGQQPTYHTIPLIFMFTAPRQWLARRWGTEAAVLPAALVLLGGIPLQVACRP